MIKLQNIELDSARYISDELIGEYKNNTYFRWYLEILRDLPKAVILVKKRGDNEFSSNVLRKALKFQFTDAILMIAKEFPKNLLFSKKYADMDYYVKLIEKHSQIQQAETKARIYSDLTNLSIFRKLKSKKLIEKIDGYLVELTPLARKIKSYDFQKYYYELQLKKAELENNPEEIVRVCRKATRIMQEKRFRVANQVIFVFSYPMIPILIQQKNYVEAETLIKSCKRLVSQKNHNWYLINLFHAMWYLRQGLTENANRLLQRVKSYPSPTIGEHYELLKYYVDFMLEKDSNLVKLDLENYQKDKYGYNIAIVIIKILQLIKSGADNDYIQLIDQREALDKYRRRTFKDEQDYRSNLFLQMILQLPYCDFDKNKYEKRTKELSQKLKSMNYEQHSLSIEIEPIPYELLEQQVKRYLKAG